MNQSAEPLRKLSVMGVRVHPLSIPDLHGLIESAIADRGRVVIVSQNLHGVHVYHRDERVRELHERAYVRIDGMPLVFWGRMLGHPVRREHRVTWVDWMPALMEKAIGSEWRIFYLGAPPGVAERGGELLRHMHPGLTLATHHGHFGEVDGKASRELVRSINEWEPDVLMVGMGMPRQEHWVLQHMDGLEVPAILTCGAAIEYFAGAIATPPRWMGRLGLEWLYRLGSNPRRLWRRYLLEPWSLSGVMLRDLAERGEYHKYVGDETKAGRG